jgi:hypothetical protein
VLGRTHVLLTRCVVHHPISCVVLLKNSFQCFELLTFNTFELCLFFSVESAPERVQSTAICTTHCFAGSRCFCTDDASVAAAGTVSTPRTLVSRSVLSLSRRGRARGSRILCSGAAPRAAVHVGQVQRAVHQPHRRQADCAGAAHAAVFVAMRVCA